MTIFLKVLFSAIGFLVGLFGPTLGVFVLEASGVLGRGFLIRYPGFTVLFMTIGIAAAFLAWRLGNSLQARFLTARTTRRRPAATRLPR